MIDYRFMTDAEIECTRKQFEAFVPGVPPAYYLRSGTDAKASYLQDAMEEKWKYWVGSKLLVYADLQEPTISGAAAIPYKGVY